jgi:hypothetical protein
LESLYRKENQTNKYYDYRPTQDWEQLNTLKVNDSEYKLNLTFKNVLKLFNLFSSDLPYRFRIEKSLELLGLDLKDEVVLDHIVKYVFDMKSSTGAKILDLEHDFKYYYADFLKLGIDLNTKDISWWEFDTLLEDILLMGNSAIGKVLEYRTYEKPTKSVKTAEEKENRFYMDKKRQYALPSPKSVENNLEKLWKYTEKRKGDLNE